LKKTFSHTRFRLSIRTVDAPTVYHRLLLFRVNKATQTDGSDAEAADAVTWKAPELYCMEETCPHLGAPLSHAELEDIEDSMAIVCPWHQYDFGT
jgi:phenylpropionate dioxygenase-like ring-hydroxylating dioxygenase large terminal subunit